MKPKSLVSSLALESASNIIALRFLYIHFDKLDALKIGQSRINGSYEDEIMGYRMMLQRRCCWSQGELNGEVMRLKNWFISQDKELKRKASRL